MGIPLALTRVCHLGKLGSFFTAWLYFEEAIGPSVSHLKKVK
jgi:hypothetical protein